MVEAAGVVPGRGNANKELRGIAIGSKLEKLSNRRVYTRITHVDHLPRLWSTCSPREVFNEPRPAPILPEIGRVPVPPDVRLFDGFVLGRVRHGR